jgi:deazaflavin-dependent oxidoreductase (nitroreductase family)
MQHAKQQAAVLGNRSKGGPQQQIQVVTQVARVANRGNGPAALDHRLEQNRALRRPPSVNGLLAHASALGDARDRDQRIVARGEQLHGCLQDRLTRRFVTPAPGVDPLAHAARLSRDVDETISLDKDGCMTNPPQKKRRADAFHRWFANPITKRLPTQVVVETTGRISGRPRRTPIGGRRDGDYFWLVSGDGESADYIRNIQANNRVRIRIAGRWHTGTAQLLPDDDARARLTTLPRFNSAMVRALGSNLLTVRIDLD